VLHRPPSRNKGGYFEGEGRGGEGKGNGMEGEGRGWEGRKGMEEEGREEGLAPLNRT